MAQSFKDIRTKGINVLSDMSGGLAKIASPQNIAEVRKSLVSACKEIEIHEVFLVSSLQEYITDIRYFLDQRRVHCKYYPEARRFPQRHIRRCL